MKRTTLLLMAIASMTLLPVSSGWAEIPAPPVNQSIGMPDVLIGDLTEADCRVCHDSGVPDRHHLLYGEPIPPGSLVPYPEAGPVYVCLSCHDEDFTVVRDCVECHTSSPHHTTPEAVALHCSTTCHHLVDNFDDGHYIPTYDPSLVTPWRGLNGDGYARAPYPTPDVQSSGLGPVTPADVTTTEGGPPDFTVNNIGSLGTLHTRAEPNVLSFKPAGANNDFVIGSTHHGGEVYNVKFIAGTPLAATFDEPSQTLTVALDTTQTALALVTTINDAVAAAGADDVEASLGYDGDGSEPLLPPTHFEPIGGDPPNSRGFGAGSCSYCHDRDDLVDVNGDPDPIILNNHDLHHGVMNSSWGGFPARCNICHDAFTTGQQSGPNFNSAIRICEKCHGPDSLHSIQVDSNGNGVEVGGELAGFGHVGRDAGPGDSDCWGCHGQEPQAPPLLVAGPVTPTISSSDTTVMNAGTDTTVILTGLAFTNTAGAELFESEVALTAADGSSVTLEPDLLLEESLAVTVPGDTPPGNYNLRAVKAADVASNPAVISVVPEVTITDATSDGTVTINGSGFGGYAEGSGTSVTGTKTNWFLWFKWTTTVEGTVVSWSDTVIEADFGPDIGSNGLNEVTVNSVFGTATWVQPFDRD